MSIAICDGNLSKVWAGQGNRCRFASTADRNGACRTVQWGKVSNKVSAACALNGETKEATAAASNVSLKVFMSINILISKSNNF
jgi:hypothetical protein